MLQIKEDPSPFNTNIMLFQGFMWPDPWCHMVIFKQASSPHPKLLSLRVFRFLVRGS